MEIKVLGTGCTKCQKLYDAAKEVLEREGIEAELVKIEKLDEIMKHGVMMTPGLIIDGELKSAGKVPREKKLVAWIREAAAKS
jgi:small redox-active disulfide protein 2